MQIFDESNLRAEIVRIWGEYGAHVEVFDQRAVSMKELQETIARCRQHIFNELNTPTGNSGRADAAFLRRLDKEIAELGIKP